jgi:hypothetical protein
MGNSTQKPRHHQVVRTTISLHPKVHDAAIELARKGAFGGLSDLIAAQIRHHAGLDDFIKTDAVSGK